MCTYCSLTDWLDCWLIPPPVSHLSSLSAFWLGLLQVLYSADIDGCTVHIPCTQAENSTWHFPGAGLEAGETEHSRTDRQVQSLTYDTATSRKPVAVKILRIQCCLETITAKPILNLLLKPSINPLVSENMQIFIHMKQNAFFFLAEGVKPSSLNENLQAVWWHGTGHC